MADTEKDQAEEREKRRRELLLALLLLLLRDTRDSFWLLLDQYHVGTITASVLTTDVMALLEGAHAHAGYLGRTLGGNRKPFGLLDAAFGNSVALEQRPRLDKFVKDLVDGRYTDDSGNLTAGAKERAALYVHRMIGTANEAWLLSFSADTKFTWHLEPGAEHCDDCLERERRSPYLRDDLPGVPADGSTECNVGCRCWLSTDTGYIGFDLGDQEI